MKTITLRKRVLTLFLAIIITAVSLQGLTVTAAAEGLIKTVVTITGYEAAGTGGTGYADSYIRADEDGQYLWVTGRVTTESGEVLPDRSVKVYYIKNGTKKYSSGTTDENGVFHAKIGGKAYFTDGSTYTVYAEFGPSSKDDKNTYEAAVSEEKSFSIVKQQTPVIETSPEHKTKGNDGSVTVIGAASGTSYQYAEENPSLSGKGNTKLFDFSGDTASALSEGTYYVRAKAYVAPGDESNTLYLASDYVAAEVESVDYTDYTVTLERVENASWSQNGGKSTFSVKEETGEKSVYISPSEGYIVESVTVTPEDGAEITYDFETGEVYVKKVRSDITLTPIVKEKRVPTSINVEYRFLSDGNYSESNPAVKVEFTVTVTDQNGEPAADATVYFSQDGDKFTTRFLQTDNEGKAVFEQTYALDSYASQFALDKDYTAPVTQELKIVSQEKTELVLYTSQIIGTDPNENNGKVINVPDNYQLWTGEVSQGAIVVIAGNEGEWIYPVNGEFTNLSAGQHIIRAGEYADYENNTFYLASDFADFMIPRGAWSVTVDTENSENVVFKGETTQKTNPESTVFIYVEPNEGYKITSYELDKPNKVSSVNYYETEGYIAVSGVYDNIVLTVKAEKAEETVNNLPESTETTLPNDTDDEPTDTETTLLNDTNDDPTDTKTTPLNDTDNTPADTETVQQNNTDIVPFDIKTAQPDETNNGVAPALIAENNVAVTESPQTGDSTNITLWIILLITSSSAILVVGSKIKSMKSF